MQKLGKTLAAAANTQQCRCRDWRIGTANECAMRKGYSSCQISSMQDLKFGLSARQGSRWKHAVHRETKGRYYNGLKSWCPCEINVSYLRQKLQNEKLQKHSHCLKSGYVGAEWACCSERIPVSSSEIGGSMCVRASLPVVIISLQRKFSEFTYGEALWRTSQWVQVPWSGAVTMFFLCSCYQLLLS